MMLNKIDSEGWWIGQIDSEYVSEEQLKNLIEEPLPEYELSPRTKWRWTGVAWEAAMNVLGHTWYSEKDSNSLWNPTHPTDTPPEKGWIYWEPGTTKKVVEEDSIAKQWKVIKQKRNKLLNNLDWMLIRAIEQDKPFPEAWKIYKQELRDITKQSDPFAINWPNPPKS